MFLVEAPKRIVCKQWLKRKHVCGTKTRPRLSGPGPDTRYTRIGTVLRSSDFVKCVEKDFITVTHLDLLHFLKFTLVKQFLSNFTW